MEMEQALRTTLTTIHKSTLHHDCNFLLHYNLD